MLEVNTLRACTSVKDFYLKVLWYHLFLLYLLIDEVLSHHIILMCDKHRIRYGHHLRQKHGVPTQSGNNIDESDHFFLHQLYQLSMMKNPHLHLISDFALLPRWLFALFEDKCCVLTETLLNSLFHTILMNLSSVYMMKNNPLHLISDSALSPRWLFALSDVKRRFFTGNLYNIQQNIIYYIFTVTLFATLTTTSLENWFEQFINRLFFYFH